MHLRNNLQVIQYRCNYNFMKDKANCIQLYQFVLFFTDKRTNIKNNKRQGTIGGLNAR